ncbi:MAG: hypothetical protein SGILL_004344, partial [Bacillariaceae sp.]
GTAAAGGVNTTATEGSSELQTLLDEIKEQEQRAAAYYQDKPSAVVPVVSPDATAPLSFFSSETNSEDGEVVEDTMSYDGVDYSEDDDEDAVGALRRGILSKPGVGGKPLPPVFEETSTTEASTVTSTAVKPPSVVDEYHAFLRQQSLEQHEEIETMLRILDDKVQVTSETTSTELRALHKKLTDAQIKQAENLKRQEISLKSSPRSTTADIREARKARQDTKKQQDEINVMLATLHEKVKQTSEHTSSQIKELYETLQEAKIQQETTHNQAMGELKQQMQEKEAAQKAHLDAIVLQYLRQQEELQEELLASEEHLVSKEGEVEAWKGRYQQLESMTVTPADAHLVLKKVQAVESSKRSATSSKSVSEVNQEVIALLSRLTQRKEHNDNQHDDFFQQLEAAKRKEAETLDELDFLKLQKELLVQDTTEVSAQEYEDLAAVEKKKFKEELAAILEAEGHRREEMDELEVELTHLAFLAVQLEECEKEFREQQALYQASLKDLKMQNETSTTKLLELQRGVHESIEQQASKGKEGGGKKGASPLSAADLRIRELERALADRDVDLANTKSELQLSQERVKLLESAISSQ